MLGKAGREIRVIRVIYFKHIFIFRLWPCPWILCGLNSDATDDTWEKSIREVRLFSSVSLTIKKGRTTLNVYGALFGNMRFGRGRKYSITVNSVRNFITNFAHCKKKCRSFCLIYGYVVTQRNNRKGLFLTGIL